MQIQITPIAREQVASYYELGAIVDSAAGKSVMATVTTVFGVDQLVLWEGGAYDQIGNWTQEQALARIDEMLAEKYSS